MNKIEFNCELQHALDSLGTALIFTDKAAKDLFIHEVRKNIDILIKKVDVSEVTK